MKFTEATKRFIVQNLQRCNYDLDRLIDEANGQRSMADSEDLRQEFITIQEELSTMKHRRISILDVKIWEHSII